jgi:hypothetical protein
VFLLCSSSCRKRSWTRHSCGQAATNTCSIRLLRMHLRALRRSSKFGRAFAMRFKGSTASSTGTISSWTTFGLAISRRGVPAPQWPISRPADLGRCFVSGLCARFLLANAPDSAKTITTDRGRAEFRIAPPTSSRRRPMERTLERTPVAYLDASLMCFQERIASARSVFGSTSESLLT